MREATYKYSHDYGVEFRRICQKGNAFVAVIYGDWLEEPTVDLQVFDNDIEANAKFNRYCHALEREHYEFVSREEA